jgi:hypothetical protein
LNAFAERHQVKVIRHAWKMPQHAPKPPAKPKGYAQAGKQFLKQWTKRYRIDMSDPGPRTDTTLALIGEKIVTAHDPLLGERYHREVMKAKWSNGADLSNIETLGVIISSLGLDKRDFVQALQAARRRLPAGGVVAGDDNTRLFYQQTGAAGPPLRTAADRSGLGSTVWLTPLQARLSCGPLPHRQGWQDSIFKRIKIWKMVSCSARV